MEVRGHKFPKTYCSSCGGEFGPGQAGYSHCDQHQGQMNEQEPAICPNCAGTGSQTFMTSHLGPDDYEFEGNCEHCLGEGTLSAGYAGALRLLEDAEKRYSRACADLWAISHVGEVEGWKLRPSALDEWQLILPKSPELSKAVGLGWEIFPLFKRPNHKSGLPPKKKEA